MYRTTLKRVICCFCCLCLYTGTDASTSVDHFRGVRWRLCRGFCGQDSYMSSTHSAPAFDFTSHTCLRAYFYRQIHRSLLLLCAVHSLHPFVSVFCVLFFVSRVWCLLSNYHPRVTRDDLFARSPCPLIHALSPSNTLLTFARILCDLVCPVFFIFDCFLLCDIFLAWGYSRHTVILWHTLAHFDAQEGLGTQP